MRNLLICAVICLGVLVPASAGAYTLVSREHGFSIELPGEPDYHGKRIIFIRDQEYDGLGWDYERYSVHFLKLTPKLGGARVLGDIITEKKRCRVVESDKAIRQGRATGRDVLIRDTQWTHRHGCGFRRFSLRVRGFVVGNRFYWVQYKIYSKDGAMTPEVTRVFDSFRVLN